MYMVVEWYVNQPASYTVDAYVYALGIVLCHI